MKTIPKLLADCQKTFNEYIRLRDRIDESCFKCISCGQIKRNDQMNAGHYYSVGSYAGLRFNEDNCHSQCIYCNKYLSGNLIEYTKNLPAKIGKEKFERLEITAGAYKRNGVKWHRFEIELLIKIYKEKVRELK